MSKEFMKLHHNNMDIASKSLELQTIGIEPLGFLGKKYGVVEQMLSNEFPGIETKDDKADIVFLLKNNSILHIEFQSTYKKSDVFRFCKYHLELYNRHKNQIESEDGIGHIRTVVVYMPNIKKESVKNFLQSEQLSFEFDSVFLNEHSGDEFFEEITKKISENPCVQLTTDEQIKLAYNPLMLKNNGDSVTERTKKVISLITTLSDEVAKFKVIGSVAALTNKFLDEDTIKAIWEVFKMSGVFQSEMNEMYNQKEKQSEIEKIKEALIKGDESEAKVLLKYSKHVSKDEYNEIKRSLNK